MRTATGLTSTEPTSDLTTADLTTADLLTADLTTADLTSAGTTPVWTVAAMALTCLTADGTCLTADGTCLTADGTCPTAGSGLPADGSTGAGDADADEAEVTLPCWTTDPDLWFAEAPADVEAAKALCVPCPLRESCLAGALERREPWGVWGGQLIVAGVVVPRKRPRGRPRKVDVAA